MRSERTLTQRQAQRRQRVLRTALELAGEGGYEGVQMREVAERADVALGTVYHYFTSKDHLLAETLAEWLRGLEANVARNPARGDTTLERVLDLLRRTTRAMQSNQKVSAALIGGLVAEGEQVAACQQEMHEMFSAMLGTAFPPDYPRDRRDKIIRSLEHIWFSELIGWKNGWNPFEQSVRELEDAAELFLAGDP
ncbi:MAG: TetR family transcriptional regulator [Acidimicrobiaceae bacterium]|nr:TetR family transcriptional regulator [Acidimicrobiaceae bacterium]